MESYTYLIIGGGMTAAAAVNGIREVDPQGSIGVFSLEKFGPYNRPPLSKKLWSGKPEDTIWLKLPETGVHLHTSCRIVSIDPSAKQAKDQAGNTYTYQRLLLATGGKPRRLPFGGDDILYYRTLADYHTVRGWTGKGARIGVIGGGFIGSELAASLASIGEQVVMVFPETGIGALVYPPNLSQYITDYYRQKGVDVRTGVEIQDLERKGAKLLLKTKGGETLEVDHVVAGIGIQPHLDLAQAVGVTLAGPQEGGGILVDETLRTNLPDVYAAGDVASFFNPALGRRMRVEHEDNANTMGRVAGLNLAGQETPYQHQPYFYSDLFDLGYEAVGELSAKLDTYADWKDPFRKGVVYYLKEDRVRGVLLWNTWDQVEAARRLIAEGRQYQKSELKDRLPEN